MTEIDDDAARKLVLDYFATLKSESEERKAEVDKYRSQEPPKPRYKVELYVTSAQLAKLSEVLGFFEKVDGNE